MDTGKVVATLLNGVAVEYAKLSLFPGHVPPVCTADR